MGGLDVLSGWVHWDGTSSALYDHLANQAYGYLESRRKAVEELDTAEQWLRRQDVIRHTLAEIVGPFPERTPLEARVVGTIAKDGYRLEKVVYESIPGLCVTGCLFIPEGLDAPRPAILNVIGHTDTGFRAPGYQQLILNLVMKGFVVFAIDPVGQGERLQYYSADFGTSLVGGSTEEHSYVGKQCFISGSNLARYRIWDGIRAIDYLLTRDEVDPHRIGVTGLSGGGTLTAYIAAFDERVVASAPACYITNWRRIFQTFGPPDAEQNLPGSIARELDHPDLLVARAPAPTMIIATTRDFVSIQGARETFHEVMRSYAALGHPERLRMAEDDYKHGYTSKTREATYGFLQRFLELPGDSTDYEVEFLTSDEMRVTQTGQVSTSLGGETVFSLNRSDTEARMAAIRRSRRDLGSHIPHILSAARTLSGYASPGSAPYAVFNGRLHRAEYSVEKYILQGEGDYPIPVLHMYPETPAPRPGVVLVHPSGKTAEAEPTGAMACLVEAGFSVFAPDLLGCGELSRPVGGWPNKEPFAAVLLGRSIVGIHAGDIVRVAEFARTMEEVDGDGLAAIGYGRLCPALLHAAAFNQAFASLALVEPLVSYRSVAMNRYYSADFSQVVSGALTAYDLPDLEASLAPRPLLLVNPVDHSGVRAVPTLVEADLDVLRAAYSDANSSGSVRVASLEPWKSLPDLLTSWLSGSGSTVPVAGGQR